MRWAQLTDTGLVRASNEDSLCVLPELGLFAVADGMGGHRAGEVASHMALTILEQELRKRLQDREEPGSAIQNAVRAANLAIYEQASRSTELMGMGTTITACLKQGEEIFVAQVGDSRAYLLKEGGIMQVTEDHSLVQELLNNGGITPEQALSHPQRNVLTRALGVEATLEVDLYRLRVAAGDMLLLCTDGLTGYLRPGEILVSAKTSTNLNEAAHTLLTKALQSGGADNITLVLVEF